MSDTNFKTYINKFAGINTYTNNYDLRGNIVVLGNGSVIIGTSNLSPISFTDVLGNITGNSVSVGNIIKTTGGMLIGDGSQLVGAGDFASVPSRVAADITGNVTGTTATFTGNVTAPYIYGNGSQMSGIIVRVPASGNIDIIGNIVAAGNADSVNVYVQNLVVRGATGNDGNVRVFGQVNALGNVFANVLSGDGSVLTGINATIGSQINVNIRGNVSAAGNVDAANVATGLLRVNGNAVVTGQVTVTGNVVAGWFIGNGAQLSGVVQSVTHAELIGNVTAPGTVTGNYLFGNAQYMNFSGNLLVQLANVANTTVRLALSNVGVGSRVYQTDTAQQYMLLYQPPSTPSNWLQFQGVNFPVQSALGRTGNVQLLSGVDLKILGTDSVVGNTNIASLAVDVNGNVQGNVVATTVTTSNMFAVTAQVSGQVTTSGNLVSTGYLFGNGAALTGLAYTLPGVGNVNITGNVVSAGNVDAANVVAGLLRVNGNAVVTGQVNVSGNVVAGWFAGNGSQITTIPISGTQNINIVGNVVSAGNVDAANVVTVLMRVNGNAVVTGQVNVTGNVVAGRFIGNGSQLTDVTANVTGTTQSINIRGNVSATGNVDAANVVTGLLRVNGNAVITSQVNVTGNVVAGWFIGNGSQITGISTVSGTQNVNIVGNVVSSGNVDAANVTTGLMRVNGNAAITGQVNVTGNVVAGWFIGNGSQITGVTTVTGTQNVNIRGNVVSTGNVDAANVVTGLMRVNGNAVVTGQVNVAGNVVAGWFIGNGSQITGITSVSATQNVNIVGNVVSAGNVDAANIVTGLMRVNGNAVVTGQVNVTGNIVAGRFIGNGSQLTDVTANVTGTTQSINVIGNVVSSGNVDAANVVTGLMRANGNAVVTGQVQVTGNVIAGWFVGNGALLTNVPATVTGTQSINVIGNVTSTGNVDAANVVASSLRVNGNAVITGQVNVVGNIVAGRFIGNGALLSNVPGVVTGTTQNMSIIGNVTSTGNVDAANVVASSLRVNGNVINTGQLNITGNITATSFTGDGALLTDYSFSSAASSVTIPSFVTPSTGFTSTVANAVTYSAVTGWNIQLQQTLNTPIVITTYTMPTNPDSPFVNLPSGVTQTLTTPWSYSAGIWTGTVTLLSTNLFAATSISMGYNSAFGSFGGNVSTTNATGIILTSVNGRITSGAATAIFSDVFVDSTTGYIWTIATFTSSVTYLGTSFTANRYYVITFNKNMTAIISSNTITTGNIPAGLSSAFGTRRCQIVSTTECYIGLIGLTANQNITIYDKTSSTTDTTAAGVLIIAKINPTAQTCSWVTTVGSTQGSGGNYSIATGCPALTLNPAGTMLVNVSQMDYNASATTVVMKNASGTTMTTATLPNVSASIYNTIGYGLSTTDGTLVTGTLFNISVTVGESQSYEIRVNDAWSNDGNVLYLPVGYYGMNTSNFYSWVSGSTWTTRFNMTTPRTTSGNSRITNYITRLPLGSTGSSWSYYQIVNSLPEDPGNFWMRTCGVGTVADGNVFLFACFQYRSVPVGAQSYTLNGTAVNLNSSSPWNPLAVWRFTDSNGTFSTPQSIVAISTAPEPGYQLGGGNGLNTNLPIMKNTQLGNSFLRIITTTTLSTAVTSSFGGQSPGNLLASQTIAPVVIDISSNLAVRNFNVITSNITGLGVTSSMGSATLKYGPSVDGSYTIGTGISNMIKVSQNGTL